MVKKFDPVFTITSRIAKDIARIEVAKEATYGFPITLAVLEKLRQTARVESIHHSTKIEGNRLTLKEVKEVVFKQRSFIGSVRDEKEVKGYCTAFDAMEKFVVKNAIITEKVIQELHALLMSDGRVNVKPTPYRDGQNVIREGSSGDIVYMPPEAKDVPVLISELVVWIQNSDLPVPLIAGIAHYQLVTIHPYYDGNGRLARLLATMILHIKGYGLKGIYSLEEYYSKDLFSYYEALTVGPSHNYYIGRADSDITSWVKYFCDGAAQSFENVAQRAREESVKKKSDKSPLLKALDVKKRRALSLFKKYETITAKQIAILFRFKPRTASNLCSVWVKEGFIVVSELSRKKRNYMLARKYSSLIE